jgi:hypothetical protein
LIPNQPALYVLHDSIADPPTGICAYFTMVKERIEVGLAFIQQRNCVQIRTFTAEMMIQCERDNAAETQRGQCQNGPLVTPQTLTEWLRICAIRPATVIA